MKKEKPDTKTIKYLNKTMVEMILIGYIGFLVLLLFLNLFLIRRERMENLGEEKIRFLSYVEDVRKKMDTTDSYFMRLYTNNNDFQILSSVEYRNEYSHVYDLVSELKLFMQDGHPSGYDVFYQDLKQSLYEMDAGEIQSESASEINNQLQMKLTMGVQNRKWEILVCEDHVYLAVPYGKNGITMFGIVSLENAEPKFSEELGRPAYLCVLEGDYAVNYRDYAEQTDISEIVRNYVDEFVIRKDNNQIIGKKLPGTDIWLVLFSESDRSPSLRAPHYILFLFTLLSIGAVMILLSYIRKEAVGPLRTLIRKMKQIRGGKEEGLPSVSSRFYELQEMDQTLDEMVEALRNQKLLAYESIIDKQKAQMQYLQLQLKPHFYLNGLKTLNALAADGKNNKIQELVLELSAHMRYLLSGERELVTLSEELAFVRNYIDMQVHITDRPISCEIHCEDELSRCLIPMLSVQTFVENSVKYARLGSGYLPLQIQIHAERLVIGGQNYLDLIIRDNGMGYEDSFLKIANDEDAELQGKVGITNIKRRGRLLFGDSFEYSFYNDQGAVAELIIPEK